MRGSRLSAVVVLSAALLSPYPALGAQGAMTATPQLAGPGAHLLTPRRAPSTSPFRKLFQVPPSRPNPSPAPIGEPTVVCGMVMIPADPSIDEGIAAPRSDQSTRFTIRAIEPPICR